MAARKTLVVEVGPGVLPLRMNITDESADRFEDNGAMMQFLKPQTQLNAF